MTTPARSERDFGGEGLSRKGVCKRCGLILHDCEPMTKYGEFWHHAEPHQKRALRCRNAGVCFDTSAPELQPFLRKGLRRRLGRAGVRA